MKTDSFEFSEDDLVILQAQTERIRFMAEIESEISSLDFQRDRILQLDPRQLPHGVSPVHDADFYMVLLRRLYRRIEDAQRDSRVANLKGKYSDLCKKIKIRDHFEHGVDINTFPQTTPGMMIITSLVHNGNDSHIISGDKKWLLTEDHERFKTMLSEFIELFLSLKRARKTRLPTCPD